MLVIPFGFLAPTAGGVLPNILTTGLQQWFAPEVATTTSQFVIDKSGNGRNGIVSGSWGYDISPELVSNTNYSKAILTDYHVDLSTSFTIQVWAQITGVSSTGECGLMHMIPNTGDSTNSCNFRYDPNASFGRLKYQLRGSSGTILNNVQYTGNETYWTMYTITYNGTTAYAYANKTLIGSTGGVMTSGKDNFFIGGIFDNNVSNYFTNLKVGSVKQYNVYHDATDIATNFDAEKDYYGVVEPILTDLEQWIDPFRSSISGATALDLSGNGNNATIQGSMTVDSAGWVLGNSKYLNLGLNNVDLSGDYTIEIWFKAVTRPAIGPSVIYVYGASGRPQTGIAQDGTSGWLSQTRNSAGSDWQMRWSGTINDSTYHQLVITRLSGTSYFYRDGVLADSNATDLGDLTSNNSFYSGGPTGTVFLRYWDSTDRMGLSRIYTKGFTQAEVVQNFNANKQDYGL